MSYRRKLLFLLLLIPAGCMTGPNPPPPPDVDLLPKHEVVMPPPQPRHEILPPVPPPPHLGPAPLTHELTPADAYHSTETWIPLEPWCHANGFGTPRRTPVENGAQFAFAGTNGTFVLRTGSEIAAWRGMELHLGFAPVMNNGHPYVHTLDIHKNILPLMQNSGPLPTPRVIVLDPGHGGTDPGAKSVLLPHVEKEYTLDWARRVGSILVANGCTVYLTRNSDITINHFDRVAVAENHHADMFVSLHFNSSFPSHAETGVETFCLTPRGMHSTETRGYRDDATATFPGNAFDLENIRLAFQVHRAILKVNGHDDRGVRRARFLTVLEEENRPAVLIEGGFLSNPTEARHIADPAYRQRLAEAVAEALLQEPIKINVAPVKHEPKPEARHE